MSFGPGDSTKYAYLRQLLDGFQQRVLEYCSSPTSEQERSDRVDETTDALAGNRSLPAEIKLAPPCPPGEHQSGGACVPNRYYLEAPLTSPNDQSA